MTQDKEETIKKIGLGILIKVDIERKCLNVTTQRTDRKKINRELKIYESEHRNKNAEVETLREKQNLKQQKK